MRIILLTLFCLISLSALCYKAVIDTYEEVQLEVYDAVIGRLATHSVTDITVQVDVREVTLMGTVSDAASRENIFRLVDGISQVRKVVNKIEIQATKQTPTKEAG